MNEEVTSRQRNKIEKELQQFELGMEALLHVKLKIVGRNVLSDRN